MSNNCYREKIDSLSDLEDRGLCIIKEEHSTVENHLLDFLKKRELTPSDLARLTGIPRQNINAVIRNNMKPGVDFVLKVCYVLNASLSDLFTLPDSAWVKPYKLNDSISLYINIVDLEIIDTTAKKIFIKSTGYEYYDNISKKFLTKEQRDSFLKEYININKKKKIDEIYKCDMSLKTTESLAIEELKRDFNQRYTKIFYKLGEKISPYILK